MKSGGAGAKPGAGKAGAGKPGTNRDTRTFSEKTRDWLETKAAEAAKAQEAAKSASEKGDSGKKPR